MAKGDAGEARSQINQSRDTFQPAMQQYTNSLYPQQQQNWQNANAAGQLQTGNYQDLMGGYGQFTQNPGIGYSTSPTMQQALAGYGGFSQTGGFSPQDLQDLRARAVSSVRSQYQNSMDQLARNKNLTGGYSPNYDAALAQMTRNQAYTTSDALTNANAGIAQMVQQGKLAGLQGLGGLSAEDSQLGLQAQQAAAQARLGGLGGAASLYGTSPALMNSFMNQVQNSNSDLANAFGLGSGYDTNLLKIQSGLADSPGAGDLALQRMNAGAKFAGSVGAGVAGM